MTDDVADDVVLACHSNWYFVSVEGARAMIMKCLAASKTALDILKERYAMGEQVESSSRLKATLSKYSLEKKAPSAIKTDGAFLSIEG